MPQPRQCRVHGVFSGRNRRRLFNLVAARVYRGLSQAQMARFVGCGQATYSGIECGRHLATPISRARISRVLDIDENWLFSSDSFTPPPRVADDVVRTTSVIDVRDVEVVRHG